MKFMHKFTSCALEGNLLPMAASLVKFPCILEHSIINFFSSALLGGCDWDTALANAVVSKVAGRTVSVRPCLKADVLQDSYEATILPF